MLHPETDPRTPYVARVLGEAPAVAATDYIKNYAD